MSPREKYDYVKSMIKEQPSILDEMREKVEAKIIDEMEAGKLPQAERISMSIALTTDGRVVLSFELSTGGKKIFGPTVGAEFMLTAPETTLPERMTQMQADDVRAAERDLLASPGNCLRVLACKENDEKRH